MMTMGHFHGGGRKKKSKQIVPNLGKYDNCYCTETEVSYDEYNQELAKTVEKDLTVGKYTCTCIKKNKTQLSNWDLHKCVYLVTYLHKCVYLVTYLHKCVYLVTYLHNSSFEDILEYHNMYVSNCTVEDSV